MARKTTAEMIGEAFREVGVLLALFAPLEWLLVRAERLTAKFTVSVIALVGLLLVVGIAFERLRKLEE